MVFASFSRQCLDYYKCFVSHNVLHMRCSDYSTINVLRQQSKHSPYVLQVDSILADDSICVL